ncbi:MAG TPA: GspH/FimT family pseudopilin [Telluria sp.]|nr:GspH/FimT family pseudopilin [Telluria sp.]
MVSARRAAGFTLIEMMVGVAIVALLSAIAAPSFNQMVASQRLKGASSDLFSALMRARSEAIKRNTEVTLSPATASQWQSGWVIPNPADSGNRIEVHDALAGLAMTGPDNVVFLANGRVKGATSPSFQLSVAGAPQPRCVNVDLSGRPYQKPSAC